MIAAEASCFLNLEGNEAPRDGAGRRRAHERAVAPEDVAESHDLVQALLLAVVPHLFGGKCMFVYISQELAGS